MYVASTFAMMDQKLENAIRKISDLTEEELSLLMGNVEKRHLQKGDKLLKAGEVCRALYLVDTGYLRTWYDKDGSIINLNFTMEGDFAANLKSSKSKLPSEVNIEAGENADVWVFSLDGIRASAKSNTQLAVFTRRLAIRLLLASEEHSELFKIYTATERYRYIEKNRPNLLQRISLSQMASYLGVTRETLSRIRAKTY